MRTTIKMSEKQGRHEKRKSHKETRQGAEEGRQRKGKGTRLKIQHREN
jgi:hypothetical protein